MNHSSPSVLIIRLDAIGDALALTPLLAALRQEGVAFDIVLSAANEDAFSPGAARERFIAPFALRDGSAANRNAIDAFGAALAAKAYTHVLVATEDMSGYRLATATRAPHRIGFDNGWGKPFKTLMIKRLMTRTHFRTAGLDTRAPHECEVLFSLGTGLVSAAHPTRDTAALQPLVTETSKHDGRVAVQLTDKYERLGIASDHVRAMLASLGGLNVRYVAAAREAPYVRAVSPEGSDVTFFDNVPDWKRALASSAAVIAPDSGAIHVAGMCGVPTVAIFPPQRNLERQLARWHPWAAPYRVIVSNDGWVERVRSALDELLA